VLFLVIRQAAVSAANALVASTDIADNATAPITDLAILIFIIRSFGYVSGA
jgi:hypothetical protein